MNRRILFKVSGKWAAMFATALVAAGCAGQGAVDELADIERGFTPLTGLSDTVELRTGAIRGQVLEGGQSVRFLGVRYAQPPVRWTAAQPAESWSPQVMPARSFPPACPQAGLEPTETSEDCLFLNVWAPTAVQSSAAPVMVWFHGGGNRTGSTSTTVPFSGGDALFDGQRFAEHHGIVVVTVQYRLGVLGFFPHPGLRQEGEPVANQGLYDQRLALRWVRDNVEGFGGDPGNVTIFGESAGAFDVCYHVAASGRHPLFHRAISQSGACHRDLPTASEMAPSVAHFEQHFGCEQGDSATRLACLRGRDLAGGQELVDAAPLACPSSEGDAGGPGGPLYSGVVPGWWFGPVMDGEFFEDQPQALIHEGRGAAVPYLLGSNHEEGDFFHLLSHPVRTRNQFVAALTRVVGTQLAEQISAVYRYRDHGSWNAALKRVTGDSLFVCEVLQSATDAAAAGLPVYLYDFNYSPGPLRPATHAAEIPYVFGTNPNPTAAQRAVSDAMQSAWARFARTGNPNPKTGGGGAVADSWPQYTPAHNRRYQFAEQDTVVVDFRARECELWRRIADRLPSQVCDVY